MKSTKDLILHKLAMAGYSAGVTLVILGVMLSLFAHTVSAQTGTGPNSSQTQTSQDPGLATQSDDPAQASATSMPPDDQGGQDTTKIATTDSGEHAKATATPKHDGDGDHDGDDRCDGDHDADDDNCGADQQPTHTPRPTHTPIAKATATQPSAGPTSQPTGQATQPPTNPTPRPTVQATATAISPASPTPEQQTVVPSATPPATATAPATVVAPSSPHGTQALLPVTGTDLSGPGGSGGDYSAWLIQIGAIILGMAFILHALSSRPVKTR